jgi:spermidine synthase
MLRLTALLLTVLTGTSALVYEVAWQKYFATLLGSHSEATAAILAIFLGGLSAGYALFGRVTRRLVLRARESGRPARLLLVYGLVEAAIGVYALLFPALFGLAQRASLLVPRGHAGLGFGFDVALSALLIGPPTVLMGGTIPVLTLALAGDLQRATRVHAWVYGFNTVGAFVGALLGGFWIVPRLGLDKSLAAMAAVNLIAGFAFAALDRRATAVAPELAPAAAAAGPVPRVAAWSAVALLAGFAMMSLQAALNRIGALTLGASQFTFAMVVAVFVLCIALGSLGVSALPRVPRGLLVGSQLLLLALLTLLYLGVPDAPYFAHVIRSLFRDADAAFSAYYALVFLALLGVLLVPIGLSGALLPLLFHQLRREVGELGLVAGRLYAWNTVGSLLGALLGGYVLLLWVDLHHVYRIALAAIAAGAAISLWLTARARRLAAGLAVLAPLAAALLFLPPWSPRRLSAGLFRERAPLPATYAGADAFFERRRLRSELRFYDDDPTSTVTVFEGPPPRDGGLNRGIVVNGKSDGNLIGDYATMALTALLPALMAERIERVFVIGWGTGVTVGEFAALEGTREIEVAEISRAVIDARPLFDPGNLEASKSPKVKVRLGDAYRTLLQSEQRYDIIASEPSNPWVTGVEMLYSIEFLEAARSRLAPGGVYAQWFHTYEIDDESVDLVLRNYAAVFPHVSVWFTLATDLLLLGFDSTERALDPAALEARFRQPDFASGFARVGIHRFPALLAHELLPIGTLHAGERPGPLHTLRHPILSYRAARAFFRGGPAALPRLARAESAAVGARNSLLRRYARAEDGRLPEPVLEEVASEYCRLKRIAECATSFARWRREYPGSPRLEEALARARETTRDADLLGDRNLASLVRLYGGAGDAGSPGDRRALQRARSVSQRYLRHYLHALPFDRGVLTRVWGRCRGEPCREARREFEARLGPLDGARGEGGLGRPPGRPEGRAGVSGLVGPAPGEDHALAAARDRLAEADPAVGRALEGMEEVLAVAGAVLDGHVQRVALAAPWKGDPHVGDERHGAALAGGRTLPEGRLEHAEDLLGSRQRRVAFRRHALDPAVGPDEEGEGMEVALLRERRAGDGDRGLDEDPRVLLALRGDAALGAGLEAGAGGEHEHGGDAAAAERRPRAFLARERAAILRARLRLTHVAWPPYHKFRIL